MIDFSKMIKEYRMIKLLTQEDLAKQIGVSVNSITRWENGHYEPTMQVKKKLRQLFIAAGMIKE